MTIECQYCKRLYNSKKALLRHQSNTRFCKDLRTSNENIKLELSHFQQQQMQYELQLERCLRKQQEEFELKLERRLKEEREHYEAQLKEEREHHEAQLKEERDRLERQNNQVVEIAKEGVRKASIVINNMTPLNLTEEHIEEVFSQFEFKHLLRGQEGLADFVIEHLLKDEDGNLMYVCTDGSRQVFKYKDEDGNTCKDQRATKLINTIHPPVMKKTREIFDDLPKDQRNDCGNQVCSIASVPSNSTGFRRRCVDKTSL